MYKDFNKLVYWIVVMNMLLVFSAHSLASTTITFYMPEWSQAGQLFKAIADDFHAQNPDITVEIIPWGGVEKLLVMAASNTLPDIISFGHQIGQIVPYRILQPLNGFISKSRIISSDVNPEAYMYFTYDNNILGLPAMNFMPMAAALYNRTFFAESGLSEPPTNRSLRWEELSDINKKLIKFDADGKLTRVGWYPAEARNDRADFVELFLGVPVINPENNLPQLNHPAFVKRLEMFYDQFIASIGTDQLKNLFGSNMGLGSWWFLSQGKTTIANYAGLLQQIRLQAPQWDFGVTWHPSDDGSRLQLVGGWGVGLSNTSKYINEAWRFIEFLATDLESQCLLYQQYGTMNIASKTFSRWLLSQVGNDPETRWFIESFELANRLLTRAPYSIVETIWSIWGDARGTVYKGESTAMAALENANIQLTARIQELQAEGRWP
jgi:ABC-type glycerol-3-phosphate transport system substrate-binding protein